MFSQNSYYLSLIQAVGTGETMRKRYHYIVASMISRNLVSLSLFFKLSFVIRPRQTGGVENSFRKSISGTFVFALAVCLSGN